MIVSESEASNKRKRILGIWNMSVAPVSLGGLLILVEELQMQKTIHGAHLAEICFVGEAVYPLPIRSTRGDGDRITLLDREACQDSALLSALLDMDGISACYQCGTIAALRDFLRANLDSYVTWPVLSEQGLASHRYASTIFAQKFYLEKGFIPSLSCKAEPIQWAVDFIQRHVTPSVPVVVHLKNNPDDRRCSNADFDAWATFLKACHPQYDAKFVLIGNEEIYQGILGLPNILVARDLGSNLSRELALIQAAFIFMGMASGPCNMALFSQTPYVIYKNPGHHVEQMALELGEANRFPFATPFQKVLRVYETHENLMSEFAHLYAHVNRQDWEKRIRGWH